MCLIEEKRLVREMKAIAISVVWVDMARWVRCWDLEIGGPTGLTSGTLARGIFREQVGAGLAGPRMSGLERTT